MSNSWQVSGKVLRELTDLDHDALFQAKAYYKGDSTITIKTDKIDATLREVIAKEYDNMKGIQKIGRNNGLCPYTPYEDLPETSRRLSEEFKKLKPVKSVSGNNHPYHSMVYLYNEIVDDYNKFCELSTIVFHLPAIRQPELFTVKYPEPKSGKPEEPKLQNPSPEKAAPKEPTSSSDTEKPKPSPTSADKMTVTHDTVYIEKRDTIYLSEPNEALRSMEGYATNNLVLLLDVSGSMNQPEKLPLLKKSVLNMLSMMRQEDRITIIAFSGKPKVLLKNTSFKEEEKIKKAVNDLSSSGKTDGNAGLKLAYIVADESYIRAGNNRIILATDGEFALSAETSALIKDYADKDIFLSVFNFGKGMGSSKALANLSKLGKGNYEAISKENVDMKLIREAKAKRKK
jgi:Mg-chelatase subunit ChlD